MRTHPSPTLPPGGEAAESSRFRSLAARFRLSIRFDIGIQTPGSHADQIQHGAPSALAVYRRTPPGTAVSQTLDRLPVITGNHGAYFFVHFSSSSLYVPLKSLRPLRPVDLQILFNEQNATNGQGHECIYLRLFSNGYQRLQRSTVVFLCRCFPFSSWYRTETRFPAAVLQILGGLLSGTGKCAARLRIR